MMEAQILIVMTTLPDRESAEHIAQVLVEERLAACASTQSTCTSIYRWEGKVEKAEEYPLWIKTTCLAYPALEQRLRECHPYELPEIMAIPITAGLPEYLKWIACETDSPVHRLDT